MTKMCKYYPYCEGFKVGACKGTEEEFLKYCADDHPKEKRKFKLNILT